jgi:hypothetical protein
MQYALVAVGLLLTLSQEEPIEGEWVAFKLRATPWTKIRGSINFIIFCFVGLVILYFIWFCFLFYVIFILSYFTLFL